MMASRTIVLWGQNDLLSYSVDLFLTTHEDWNVVNMLVETDLNTLFQLVEDVKPDVVIIQQGGVSFYSSAPARLLQDHPGLKVITLSLKNNLMEVYIKQNILIQSSTDLFSAIEARTCE